MNEIFVKVNINLIFINLDIDNREFQTGYKQVTFKFFPRLRNLFKMQS